MYIPKENIMIKLYFKVMEDLKAIRKRELVFKYIRERMPKNDLFFDSNLPKFKKFLFTKLVDGDKEMLNIIIKYRKFSNLFL